MLYRKSFACRIHVIVYENIIKELRIIGENNMPAITVLSSSTLSITRSHSTRYAYQRYWNCRKVFEIPRFPRSDAHAGIGGEKTMLQRPEPLSSRSRWRPFPCSLLSFSSLYLAGLLSSLFLFFISLSLPPACSLLATLWWKFFCMPLRRLVSRNATQCNPGMHCESDSWETTRWRRQYDDGRARWYLS